MEKSYLIQSIIYNRNYKHQKIFENFAWKGVKYVSLTGI